MGVYGRRAAIGMMIPSLSLPTIADRPKITMEDLQVVEHIVRVDPKVIEQCQIIGIPKEDMHKVYCDRRWLHLNETAPNLIVDSLDHWL